MCCNNKQCDYLSLDIKEEMEFEVPIMREIAVRMPKIITRQSQAYGEEERTPGQMRRAKKTHHCYLCALPDSRAGGGQSAAVKRGIHVGVFDCGVCAMLFPTALQRNIHVERVHIGRPYPCSMCDKSFKNYPSLQRHVQYIHDPQAKYSCPLCGKTFMVKTHFKYHMQSYHEKIRHKCPLCFSSYTSKSYLKVHVMQMHGSKT